MCVAQLLPKQLPHLDASSSGRRADEARDLDPAGRTPPLTYYHMSIIEDLLSDWCRSFQRLSRNPGHSAVSRLCRMKIIIIIPNHFSGVYMSLNGIVISNNSYIGVSNIGEGDNALLCHTDNHSCCQQRRNRAGEWYFPNGRVVGILGNQNYHGDYFYRNRGEGQVRLNRVGNPSESGYFCCRIPDARSVNQTLHVNIGELAISVTMLKAPVDELLNLSLTF